MSQSLEVVLADLDIPPAATSLPRVVPPIGPMVGDEAIATLRWIAAKARRGGVAAEVFADLLAADPAELGALLNRYGLTSDSFADALREIVERAPDDGYLGEAPDLIEAPAPFDPSRNRKRADGTVRGRRDGYVIGGHDYSTCDRMSYREALERANAMLHLSGSGAEFDLIGTDEYSWAQVVTYRPAFYGARPEGAGRSLVGDGRKSRRVTLPRPNYRDRISCPVDGMPGQVRSHGIGKNERRAEQVEALEGWPIGYRIVKRYRTTYRGREIVGHGHWSGTDRIGPRKVTRKRGRRLAPVEIGAAQLIDDVANLAPGIASRTAFLLPDGTKVTVANEPDRRRFRVTLTTTTGTRFATTTRTASAAARAIAARVN